MEVLIYVCFITLALGICGFFSDLICKRTFEKKSSKKVLVQVYSVQGANLSRYTKKSVVDKHKDTRSSEEVCA